MHDVLNSLGFVKPPAETRVVVAMSGGVDSSVTAALLHEAGYDVVGVTLQLYDAGWVANKKGACCAGEDIYDARLVAGRLGIPHYILDYESRFRDAVMEEFADAYLRGETPIPCVTCNRTVKFRDLVAAAKELGADCLATGHYARRLENGHGPELHTGPDPRKDQSYFLFATTREQLDFLRFPLGGMEKPEVRAHAARFGLEVADKPDSQDICFVPDGDYASVIARMRPGASEPGSIVDVAGVEIGRHEGILHYTIGQRKGLGIGGQTEPLYVVGIEPEGNKVIAGPKSALAASGMTVRDVNWLTDGGMPYEGSASVKIRSSRPPVPARVEPVAGGRAQVQFAAPEFGVSPGQAAVFYDGSRVLGGGWIMRTERAGKPEGRGQAA